MPCMRCRYLYGKVWTFGVKMKRNSKQRLLIYVQITTSGVVGGRHVLKIIEMIFGYNGLGWPSKFVFWCLYMHAS